MGAKEKETRVSSHWISPGRCINLFMGFNKQVFAWVSLKVHQLWLKKMSPMQKGHSKERHGVARTRTGDLQCVRLT
ncbi:Uncharacterized protein TCM_000786 [Theobroma cacao]|uniref:Uncharacterized protein n=1 Tax=Theobroma cacao TaxID=3641 RepID=A0A061DP22_THECC|nr:Uncharacterized protein TCM_000786 [Theobroma cacao]